MDRKIGTIVSVNVQLHEVATDAEGNKVLRPTGGIITVDHPDKTVEVVMLDMDDKMVSWECQ